MGTHISQNIWVPSQNFRHQMCDMNQVHTEGPQTLITTVKKFWSTANLAPGICAHLIADAGRSEENHKKKTPVWISGVVGKIRTGSVWCHSSETKLY